MAVNILYSKNTVQPLQRVMIDWSNPITRGLSFCQVQGVANGATGYRVNTGNNFTPYNNATTINTTHGKAAQTSTFLYDTGNTDLTGTDYSLLAVGNCTNTSSIQNAIDDDNGSGSGRCFQFRINASKAEIITFNTGGVAHFATATAMTAGKLSAGFVIGASVKGNNFAVFQNGVKTAAVTSNTQRQPTGNLRIGANKAAIQPWSTGGISLVAGWSRTLTDSEQRSLSENPWQLFQPTLQKLWVESATGIVEAVGSSVGASTAAAQALSIFQAAGFAAGSSTISGVINAIYQSSGSSAGISSVNAVVNAIWNSVGNASGISTANASTNSVWVVVGNSQGSSIANGSTTSTTIVSADGSSVGVSTADAIAASIIAATGGSISTSAGNANAVAIKIAVGSSAGTSSVDAIVQTIKSAVGNATGSCVVQGVGDGGIPPGELTPITGNVSVTIITAKYGIQNLTSVFGASLL